VSETEPKEQGLESRRWTVKKIQQWVKKVFQCEVSRSLLLRVMNMGKLSWKKCQKVLGRAKPEKQAAYIAEFQKLFAEVCAQEKLLIYVRRGPYSPGNGSRLHLVSGGPTSLADE